MRPDSVFNLGSITKPFTAAAILRLQELGKLKTSDPVSRFFDGVPEDKAGDHARAPPHPLLGPRVGLQPHRLRADDARGVRAARARLEAPLRPGPGLRVRERGLQPARRGRREGDGQGLRDGPRRARPEAARAWPRPATRPRAGTRRASPTATADGEDWGTILGRIQEPGRAVLGAARQRRPPHDARRHGALGRGAADDAVLTAASRESYFRPRVAEGPGARSHYAFGWAVEKTPHGTLVQHNGGNGIYVAELLRFVDEGVMIFLASTVAELKATPVVPALTAIVFGEPYDLPPAVVTLSPEALRARAGRYRAPSGAEVAVRAVEGGLEIDGLRAGRLRSPRRRARGRARAVRAPGSAHRGHRGTGLQGRPDRHPRGPRRAPGPRADPRAGGRAHARPRGAPRAVPRLRRRRLVAVRRGARGDGGARGLREGLRLQPLPLGTARRPRRASRPAPSRRERATSRSRSGSSWPSASAEAAARRGASRSRARAARPSSSSRARTARCACARLCAGDPDRPRFARAGTQANCFQSIFGSQTSFDFIIWSHVTSLPV